jgi:flagellar L-ring protein precursor FlgH
MRIQASLAFIAALGLAGCDRLGAVGQTPGLSPVDDSLEVRAMTTPGLPLSLEATRRADAASTWSGTRSSLLGDRRANLRGDILTVVIEIDDSAEISNSTSRARSGSESLGIAGLFGLPQAIGDRLPDGATLADAVDIQSRSRSGGEGSVSRNEQLELRVAATVIDVLNNGVLRIQGSQEVRVNNEIRELIVTGFVRSEDISRQNEITYDKIASARISYGGRGQISDVQQPRYGQQVSDILLPF